MCSMLIKASGSKLNPNPHPPHLAFSNMHQFTTQCILYVIFVIWPFDFVTLILFLKLNRLWLYDLDIWHHWPWTFRDIVNLSLTLWPWNVRDIVIFTLNYLELWPCVLDFELFVTLRLWSLNLCLWTIVTLLLWHVPFWPWTIRRLWPLSFSPWHIHGLVTFIFDHLTLKYS